MKKKIFAILLTVIMSTALFAGCRNNNEGTTNNAGTNAPTETATLDPTDGMVDDGTHGNNGNNGNADVLESIMPNESNPAPTVSPDSTSTSVWSY